MEQHLCSSEINLTIIGHIGPLRCWRNWGFTQASLLISQLNTSLDRDGLSIWSLYSIWRVQFNKDLMWQNCDVNFIQLNPTYDILWNIKLHKNKTNKQYIHLKSYEINLDLKCSREN